MVSGVERTCKPRSGARRKRRADTSAANDGPEAGRTLGRSPSNLPRRFCVQAYWRDEVANLEVAPLLRGSSFGGSFEELASQVCITDGGFWVDGEHGNDVERVRPVSEGFFELAVDPQAFEGCCEPAPSHWVTATTDLLGPPGYQRFDIGHPEAGDALRRFDPPKVWQRQFGARAPHSKASRGRMYRKDFPVTASTACWYSCDDRVAIPLSVVSRPQPLACPRPRKA